MARRCRARGEACGPWRRRGSNTNRCWWLRREARIPEDKSQRSCAGARRQRHDHLGVDGNKSVCRGEIWEGTAVAVDGRGPWRMLPVELMGDARSGRADVRCLQESNHAAGRRARRESSGRWTGEDEGAAEGARRSFAEIRISAGQGFYYCGSERRVRDDSRVVYSIGSVDDSDGAEVGAKVSGASGQPESGDDEIAWRSRFDIE